jgi:hypothetical protein
MWRDLRAKLCVVDQTTPRFMDRLVSSLERSLPTRHGQVLHGTNHGGPGPYYLDIRIVNGLHKHTKISLVKLVQQYGPNIGLIRSRIRISSAKSAEYKSNFGTFVTSKPTTLSLIGEMQKRLRGLQAMPEPQLLEGRIVSSLDVHRSTYPDRLALALEQSIYPDYGKPRESIHFKDSWEKLPHIVKTVSNPLALAFYHNFAFVRLFFPEIFVFPLFEYDEDFPRMARAIRKGTPFSVLDEPYSGLYRGIFMTGYSTTVPEMLMKFSRFPMRAMKSYFQGKGEEPANKIRIITPDSKLPRTDPRRYLPPYVHLVPALIESVKNDPTFVRFWDELKSV